MLSTQLHVTSTRLNTLLLLFSDCKNAKLLTYDLTLMNLTTVLTAKGNKGAWLTWKLGLMLIDSVHSFVKNCPIQTHNVVR